MQRAASDPRAGPWRPVIVNFFQIVFSIVLSRFGRLLLGFRLVAELTCWSYLNVVMKCCVKLVLQLSAVTYLCHTWSLLVMHTLFLMIWATNELGMYLGGEF